MRIFYDRLSSALWVALVSLLVLLAIYVSVGRLLTANLAAYREPILQELNVRLPFTVEAGSMSGRWQSFSPLIVMRDLRVSFPEQDLPPLAFSEGRIRIDVLNSLRTGALQVRRVEVTALKLRGELDGAGGFQLTGFGAGQGNGARWLEDFLLNIESLKLTDNVLDLGLPDGERRQLALDFLLERESSRRRLQAELKSTAGAAITVLAEGVGNPFTPEEFNGRGYLRVDTSDLGAMQALMPQDMPLRMDGRGEVQLWLDLADGQPRLEAYLDARELDLTGTSGDWHVPLDHLSVNAQVSREKNRWTLFASDLSLARDDAEFLLPTVQFDAWEDSLRLRFPELALSNALALVNEMRALPDGLREVLNELAPVGLLPALEVSVLDLAQPADSWRVRATFDDLEVTPFRGAPGVTGASGFADISPRGGRFILDSENIALAFPAIYRAPLTFDDLSGELGLTWDSEAVRLRSDLITARGEEGTARALFGLRLPLEESPTGPEMDLMVGLRDFDVRFRDKYLPFTLPDSLLSWLERSIVSGHVDAGAFLYRGSLRAGASAMRSVQLAFNVAQAELDYDPRWPAARLRDGIVLLDDGDVSVWADQAGVYASTANNVSVETTLGADGVPLMSLQARIAGPAADGLRILNESALSGIVGGAFADWRARGELQTALDLELALQDGAAPRVNVLAQLRDVGLDIAPGNLPLRALQGEFGYSTTEGFSARDLRGTLWGKTLSAGITQQHGESGRFAAGSSEVRVNFKGAAATDSVRHWLGLDLLALAQGNAAVTGAVVLRPGQAPLLEVDSDLQGVALDLPEPWRKAREEARAFKLRFPLGGGDAPLTLGLGKDLALALQLGDATEFGGALGINEPPAALESGVFRVTGAAPFIEADQWVRFAGDYLVTGAVSGSAVRAESAPPPDATASGAAPRVVVDGLRAQILRILGRTLEAARLSVDLGAEYWQVALETGWLRGSGALARAGGQSRVTVDYLDLDRLPEFLSAAAEGGDAATDQGGQAGALAELELPEIAVRLLNLHQGERRLGELEFSLVSDEERINLDRLGGELAGLRLLEGGTNWLAWQRGEQEQTELSLQLVFDNIGDTLDYFGYQRIVETRRGKLALDLGWPGAPTAFQLATAAGELALGFGSGNFLAVPAGASGALRVVSILNLFDIVRRLSLTHMFESGIPFDSVKGTVEIADGRITVPGLAVKGGSSFKFSGVSNVAQRSLSGELVATLPLANNLPWIAALAANLPVAAGVFVISKLFDKQMQRLSSAVYSIKGTWDEPQIAFDRVFDDRSKGVPREKGVKGEQGGRVEKDKAAPDSANAPAVDGAAASAEQAAGAPAESRELAPRAPVPQSPGP